MYETIIADMKKSRFTSLSSGVGQSVIDAYSKRLPWEFDVATSNWFLECGQGGKTLAGSVFGLCRGDGGVFITERVPGGLAIASDGCGSYYTVFPIRGNHCVFLVDCSLEESFDKNPPVIYSSSVFHFWLVYSRALRRRRYWYTSKRGLLRLDPDLEKYSEFVRPWQEKYIA